MPYYLIYVTFKIIEFTDFGIRRYTYCVQDYGNFETFKEAKEACSSDANCNAIYDHHCDNDDDFVLCAKNTELKMSVMGSCVYPKKKSSFI